MSKVLLTQDPGLILGPIAKVLGKIIEGIFFLISSIGIPNIALAIILFTVVIYLLLTPLTIKQQKFSKFSAVMNPELMAIREKYKNRKDNESMMAMNSETQAVYDKYGVSPSGSCVQLLIQMPILFALYRVIYAIPAYIGSVKDTFMPVVEGVLKDNKIIEFVKNLPNSQMYTKQFANEAFNTSTEYAQNTIVDCLNRASTQDWSDLAAKFPELADEVSAAVEQLDQFNSFFILNIANSPKFTISTANGNTMLIVAAILVPFLAAFTQWFNAKLMTIKNSNGDDSTNPMAQSMKTMNVLMPIMSAFFCYTLPLGMGLYWIASAVVRTIQQIVINKHIDKMDLQEEIKKNIEKKKKKLEKKGVSASTLNNYASMSTRNYVPSNDNKNKMSQEEKDAAIKKATEYYNKNAKPGSIAAKANMVKQYNERNNK